MFKQGGVDSMSHLLFADDILVFGQTTRSSLIAVKEDLDIFSNFMQLQINASKSGVAYSKSCVSRSLEGVINLPTTSFPIKYLGMQ